MLSEVLEIINKSLLQKSEVYIHHNNERGFYEYSVALSKIPDFWLDSFKTKKAAIEYCKLNNLPIKYYINKKY